MYAKFWKRIMNENAKKIKKNRDFIFIDDMFNAIYCFLFYLMTDVFKIFSTDR